MLHRRNTLQTLEYLALGTLSRIKHYHRVLRLIFDRMSV